jgi:hypothetical protein
VALTIKAVAISIVKAKAIIEGVSPHGVDTIKVIIRVTMFPMDLFPIPTQISPDPTPISQTLTLIAQPVKYAINKAIQPLIATIK